MTFEDVAGVETPLPLAFGAPKTCHLCGKTKAISEFHRHAKSPDGHQGRCKDCACALARSWSAENKERASKNKREYYSKHKAALLKKNRGWAESNKERMLEFGRKCWAKNRDKRNTRKRAYRAENKEKQKAYYRQYHAARPGLKNAWDAERRAAEKQALPRWADKAAIKAFYAEARRRTAEIGIQYHVDHRRLART